MMPVAVEMSRAGDLADETVAYGERDEGIGGLTDFHASLEYANGKATDDVDQDDDDGGDGVAADESGGTVHGAVEVGFAFDVATAGASFIFGDDAGVEVGVDG